MAFKCDKQSGALKLAKLNQYTLLPKADSVTTPISKADLAQTYSQQTENQN